MFDRTIESDPRPAAPQSRTHYRMRDGHRREYDAREGAGSISFRDRSERALADVGIYRCVSFRDLAEARFGGHPYTTRRAVNAWIRAGLARESTANGPKGRPFKVLTLTRKGAAAVRDLAIGQGLERGQHIDAARPQHAQLAHDTAIYRACGLERRRLLEQGATIRRVRLDGELKGAVARRSESARGAGDGRRAAGRGRRRHQAARELLGSPSTPWAACSTPTRRSSTRTQTAAPVASMSRSHPATTRQGSVRAKAAAGFRMHANGPGREKGPPHPRRGATTMPPYEGRPSAIRPRSSSKHPHHATLEDQHGPDCRTRGLRPPTRRVASRVPRAVLAVDPR